MSSDTSFIEFVINQIDDSNEITVRQMFGGHTLYSKGKVVGLICDNQLYVKPTKSGRAFIGEAIEAPAYTGAKPSFLIEDKIENSEWLSELIRVTEKELPKPRPKKTKAKTKTNK